MVIRSVRLIRRGGELILRLVLMLHNNIFEDQHALGKVGLRGQTHEGHTGGTSLGSGDKYRNCREDRVYNSNIRRHEEGWFACKQDNLP